MDADAHSNRSNEGRDARGAAAATALSRWTGKQDSAAARAVAFLHLDEIPTRWFGHHEENSGCLHGVCSADRGEETFLH